ncbi:MAG: hypothetical protein EA405_12185 [Rhodospirillales bacterium]|nr:MAG: hypothetical protein EA405_12185 [Rhodospirillales bacterium]
MTPSIDRYPFGSEPKHVPTFGVAAIEAEHRELQSHYRALLRALREGEGVTAFGLSFYSFLVHLRRHFHWEEDIMERTGFPDRTAHKSEHDKLMNDAGDFLSSVLNRFEKDDCSAVAKYFGYWLMVHVERHDKELAFFLDAPEHEPLLAAG